MAAFKEKFSDKDITLIQGSYFDVPFCENAYDTAVYTPSKKIKGMAITDTINEL